MRKLLITALLCTSSTAAAQTIPSCEKVVSELRELTIVEGELTQRFYEGSASAARCTFEDSITCEDLRLGGVYLKQWKSDGEVVLAQGVDWTGGRVAHIEIRGSTWTLSDVYLASHDLSIQRITHTGSSCHRRGLTFGEVAIEELRDDAVVGSVYVDSLPVASPGLLPPRLRFADGELEGSLYGTLLDFDGEFKTVGLAANITPGAWFGGGLTYSGLDIEGRSQWVSLELNVQDSVTLSALGSLSLHGADAHRLGASLEMAPTGIWATRRLENGAWRKLQDSRAGISLRGPRHELSVGAGVSGHSDLTDIFVRFGTSLGTDWWKTHLDLDHLTSRAPNQEEYVHSSLVGVRVERQLARGASRLVPFVDIATNFGVVPTEVGFEASTSATVMPGADLSTTFIGRFDNATHILRPRVFGSAEVYGFTQRGILSANEPPFPFTRQAGLYHVWAGVEQEWHGAFSIRAPLGVHAQGTAEEDLRVVPVGEIDFDLRNFRVGGALRCAQACSGLEWRGHVGLENEDASIEIGAQDFASWWAPISEAGPVSRWSQLHKNEQHLGFFSYLSGGIRAGRIQTHSRLLTDFDEWGISLGARWNLDALGWAWGVEAAHTPDGELLGFVGLQMAR